jgi:hypothetical protein
MIIREQERLAKNVLNCAYALTIPPSFVRLRTYGSVRLEP